MSIIPISNDGNGTFLGSNRAAYHLPRVSGDVWRAREAKGLPKYKILIFEIIGFRIKMCDDLEP